MKKFSRFVVVALVVFFGWSASVSAQAAPEKKPLTHEKLWLLKRVGAPAVSPDGKWAVFSVAQPAYDPKEQISDLWIVSTDGQGEPRRLTATKSGESGVAWSPDSRRIAFTAKREGDETSQIYILNVVESGEAVRATSLSTGARDAQWRPDGKALLFTSDVFPGALDDEANKKIAAERKARKYNVRAYDGFPIRQWDHWLDDTQPHVFVQSLDPPGDAKDLLAGTKLVSEKGFGGQGGADSPSIDPVWTPEGDAVVFVASTDNDRAAHAETTSHLYMVPATGGEPRQLTTGDANFGSPKFRPDGKALYAGWSPNNGKSYNLTRLVRFDWPSVGAPKNLTAAFDRSVGTFAFGGDGRTVYILAEEAGHQKLFLLPADGGEVRLAFEVDLGTYSGLSVAEKSSEPILVSNWESTSNPKEIVRIDPAKGHRALTRFTEADIADIDCRPVRHFWFTSKKGKKIHNILVYPPGFDEGKKYPLISFIHGGAANMWLDQFHLRWNYNLLAAPGYVLVLTNYTGSTGFGEKFSQDIQGDPLATCGSEVDEAVDAAIKQFPFIDGNRLAAGGASYGGHLANWLQATTTRYKCLFSHAGLINLESQWGTSDTIYGRELTCLGPVWEQNKVWREQNPIRHAAKFRTPMFLSVGENDFRVPLNQTLENWSVLQRLKIPSRLLVFPDENHWILKGENNRYFFKELHGWLAKYLQ